MTKEDYFKDIAKVIDNNYATVASDGTNADIAGFIDTGSYVLNALISGSIFRGLPANKITALAGEEATGKTFFLLGIVKSFLDKDPRAVCFFFESEGSVTKEILESRGIDTKRVMVVPVETVQQFKTQAIKVVNSHLNTPKEKQRPVFVALDSLGMLSTTKEMEDSESGKDVVDFTRPKIIRAAFRTLTMKMSKANIPCVFTNHVYTQVGQMYATKEMGGGCLTKGHKILMADNSYKNIEDIEIGDSVKTLLGKKEVVTTFNFKDKELYELELINGTTVKCSSEHRFLLESGEWITAQKIFDLMNQGKNINILTYEESMEKLVCLKEQNIQVGII